METTMAYLAGFIDGEGSISIGTNRGLGRYYLRLSCHQVDRRPLDLLRETFGGSIRGHQVPGRQYIWEWAAASEIAHRAIEALRPWLIVKADQADVALTFQALVKDGRHHPRGDEGMAAREELYQKLRDLKRPSKTHDET